MSQELEQLLNKTKLHLFMSKGAGFLGTILCKTNFIWTDKIGDHDNPTAAVDGLNLYWNPDFFLRIDPETRVTVLAHELWHIALLHIIRGKGFDPETYNIAADHVINLMLKEHGYYMGGFPYYMDPMFTGWATDDIYNYLIINPPPPCPDMVLGGDIKPFPKDDQLEDSMMIETIISAAQVARMTGSAGDIPGEVTMVLESFLRPKLPWKNILHNYFNEMVDEEYSYKKPNRRYQDMILPGLVGLSGLEHLMFAVDVSGSITDDQILRTNSEVNFIKNEFDPEKLTLVTFDTKIRDIYVFEKDDPFEKLLITGRGGTDLYDILDYAKKQRPSALVILSDLYVHIPEEDPELPIIWICVGNPDVEVPYGKLIHLTDD